MPATARHPVVESLRNLSAPVLSNQLQDLFHNADDVLFEMSARASSDADRKLHFDTMRLLRLEQRGIRAAFEAAFADSFIPGSAGAQGDVDFDRLSVMATDELEETLAISQLSDKAESRYPTLLQDLGQRIDAMIRTLGIPISSRALSPASICESFRLSLQGLKLDLNARLLLFKLFDRFVVGHFDDLYQVALRVLDKHGVRAQLGVNGHPAQPPVTGAPAARVLPTVDSDTLAALAELSRTAAASTYQDAELANDLLDCASAASGRGPYERGIAAAQRLSLVGQMINEILSDPHLPDSMRPLFARLRIPLIKIVLADGSFYANRGHPVRRLVAEAAETAAASRAANAMAVHRLEERLRQIAEQIDLSAAFVRPHLATLAPLSEIEINAFLDQQREESETRRENVLNKVRRTVAQELETHTLGRGLPEALGGFLRAGWGPLMAARLLRSGMSSQQWIEAVNRLIQILATLDIEAVTPEQIEARRQLDAAVAADLAEIGMGEERIAGTLEQLRQAYAELDSRVAASVPPPAADDMLSAEQRKVLLKTFPQPSLTLGESSPKAPRSLHRPRPGPLKTDPKAAAPIPLATPITSRQLDQEPPPASVPEPKTLTSTLPVTSSSPAQADLLARCLTAESWFRVFDAISGQTLWLKVTRYYPEHDSVSFSGFDAKKTLAIRASRFLQDLIQGRSEPVNATPAQQRALLALREQRTGG